jgi:hypothetical protein
MINGSSGAKINACLNALSAFSISFNSNKAPTNKSIKKFHGVVGGEMIIYSQAL